MGLLACFSAVLGRWSGQDDIVIGCPVANRGRPEVEKLIGFFANTLVIRTRVDDELTFRQLLKRVKTTCLDAYSHQDLPFERVVEDLNPQRSLSRNPLFQVAFGIEEIESEARSLVGLELTLVSEDVGTSRFDLEVLIHDQGTTAVVECIYDTEAFFD